MDNNKKQAIPQLSKLAETFKPSFSFFKRSGSDAVKEAIYKLLQQAISILKSGQPVLSLLNIKTQILFELSKLDSIECSDKILNFAKNQNEIVENVRKAFDDIFESQHTPLSIEKQPLPLFSEYVVTLYTKFLQEPDFEQTIKDFSRGQLSIQSSPVSAAAQDHFNQLDTPVKRVYLINQYSFACGNNRSRAEYISHRMNQNRFCSFVPQLHLNDYFEKQNLVFSPDYTMSITGSSNQQIITTEMLCPLRCTESLEHKGKFTVKTEIILVWQNNQKPSISSIQFSLKNVEGLGVNFKKYFEETFIVTQPQLVEINIVNQAIILDTSTFQPLWTKIVNTECFNYTVKEISTNQIELSFGRSKQGFPEAFKRELRSYDISLYVKDTTAAMYLVRYCQKYQSLSEGFALFLVQRLNQFVLGDITYILKVFLGKAAETIPRHKQIINIHFIPANKHPKGFDCVRIYSQFVGDKFQAEYQIDIIDANPSRDGSVENFKPICTKFICRSSLTNKVFYFEDYKNLS